MFNTVFHKNKINVRLVILQIILQLVYTSIGNNRNRDKKCFVCYGRFCKTYLLCSLKLIFSPPLSRFCLIYPCSDRWLHSCSRAPRSEDWRHRSCDSTRGFQHRSWHSLAWHDDSSHHRMLYSSFHRILFSCSWYSSEIRWLPAESRCQNGHVPTYSCHLQSRVQYGPRWRSSGSWPFFWSLLESVLSPRKTCEGLSSCRYSLSSLCHGVLSEPRKAGIENLLTIMVNWLVHYLAGTVVIFAIFPATFRTDLSVVMHTGFLLSERHNSLSCREEFLNGEDVFYVEVIFYDTEKVLQVRLWHRAEVQSINVDKRHWFEAVQLGGVTQVMDGLAWFETSWIPLYLFLTPYEAFSHFWTDELCVRTVGDSEAGHQTQPAERLQTERCAVVDDLLLVLGHRARDNATDLLVEFLFLKKNHN